MKHVLLVTTVYPPDAGGPARQVFDTFNFLKNHKNTEPWIITFHNPKRSETYKNHAYIPVFNHLPLPLASIARQSYALFLILKTIRKKHINLVICSDIRVLGLVTGIACSMLRVKSVIKYPGDIVFEIINQHQLYTPSVSKAHIFSKKAKLFSLFQKFIFSLFDTIWCPSQYQASLLKKIYNLPEDRIKVYPNSIQIEKTKKTKIGKTPHIMLIGRDVPWKQIRKISQVLQHLQDIPLKITLVGTNASITKASKHHTITSLGEIPITKVRDIYQSADILLSLTAYEPFGIIFIEAAMHGLVRIAPNIGGIPEVIKHNHSGVLFPAENWTKAADQIRKIVSSKALQNKYRNNAYQELAQYDISARGEQYMRLLSS